MKDFTAIGRRDPGVPMPARFYQAGGLKDSVIIPGLQAVMAGLFMAVLSGGLAMAMKVDPFTVGAVAGAASALLAWFSSLNFWRWTIERVLSDELNIFQPGQAARAPDPAPVRVEVIQDEGRIGDFMNLPYADRLPLLADGLASGRTFSTTAWTGSGALFTRPEFEELRDKLIKGKLARWRNDRFPGQGFELTASGRAVFRRLAKASPSPTDEQFVCEGVDV